MLFEDTGFCENTAAFKRMNARLANVESETVALNFDYETCLRMPRSTLSATRHETFSYLKVVG